MNAMELAKVRENDRRHTWHPFTPSDAWCAEGHAPLVLVEGEGAMLRDAEGRWYLDGNSSIWTNLHGHRNPRIDAAIRDQLARFSHVSFLGATHAPAAQLAQELVALWPPNSLTRVFFSDDGSTAIEVALKIAAQFFQQTGQPQRMRFVVFENAYHGDTMGASSLGGIATFHGRFANWQFPVERVWTLADLENLAAESLAAVIVEPLIQGAAGFRLWPRGMLADLRAWCTARGVLLILDEVMTGFGRTGKMFACEHENVVPDIIALAKGLTGGTLPLAATMVGEKIFDAFRGPVENTLFYGHSYTANALGCAAALASLAIFREERVLEKLAEKIAWLQTDLAKLRESPFVYEIRQCGLMAGIELRERDGGIFPPAAQIGARVCLAARRHGLLTRPIRDTLVFMPPFPVTKAQLESGREALALAIEEICGV